MQLPARLRPVRLPRAAVLALACLPGAAAVTVLGLCASGVEREGAAEAEAVRKLAARPAAHGAPRPSILPRSAWLAAPEAPGRPTPRYDDKVVAVFVHHTDSPNGYDCADTPNIIRALSAGQTGVRDWDDIGYNFLVDRCGVVYEGRAGGVTRAVTGAHTQGFNHRTAGIAAIGTFTAGAEVPRVMTDAIAGLAAWKLGLAGADPRGRVRLVSSNSLSRYVSGTPAVLPSIAGHNDGFMTSCPGAALTARLPEIRERAARLQGRAPAPGLRPDEPTTPASTPASTAAPTGPTAVPSAAVPSGVPLLPPGTAPVNPGLLLRSGTPTP